MQRVRAVQPVRHGGGEGGAGGAATGAGGIGYGEAKKLLLEKINAYFGPAREKRKQLAAHPEHVEEVLREGSGASARRGEKTMALVREAVGMKAAPVA